MHLNSILERVRLIDATGADEVQAIRHSGDTDQQLGALSGVIGDLNAAERIHSDSAVWAKLFASFTALAQVHAERGEADQARESFQRAAIYGLLMGDSLLRSNSLQAADNVEALISSLPQPEEAPADEVVDIPKHASAEEDAQADAWASAAEIVELPADEFSISINELAGMIGSAQEAQAVALINDCYQALAAQLSKASQDRDEDRQILVSEKVIAAAHAAVPPSAKLLADSVFSKTVVLSSRGYSPQLKQAVAEAVDVLRGASDPNLAADTQMLCYRSLVSMADAAPERKNLLEAAGAHFAAASNTAGMLDCKLESGIEFQRTGDFATAFSVYQGVSEKAAELRFPGAFTKACFLLGDSWGFAIREQKIDAYNGIMRAANEYRRAVSTFSEQEYTAVEDKRNLALGLLKMAALLHNKPEAASYLKMQPGVFASNANRIFESIGDNLRASQALQYV